MRCEFQAGDLDRALFSGLGRPDWLDETGRCKLSEGEMVQSPELGPHS